MGKVLDNPTRQLLRVRYFDVGGVTQTELAREYGVSPSHMCKVLNGLNLQCLALAELAVQRTKYESLHPLYQRRNQLWDKYRLRLADYEAMLEAQGWVCKLCKEPPPEGKLLHVDHDHACCPTRPACGKCNRGLLCHGCNRFLGWAEKIGLPSIDAYLNGWR